MGQSKKELFITHLFDAPRELVFNAWTDPEQLKHWYAPDGCTIEFKYIDVKEGGTFHSCIHDPIHGDCWIKGVYDQVIFPEKLVFSMILTNENGESIASVAAGKPEDWPEETITTVTFTSIGNQTKLAIHQTVSEEDAKQTGAYQSWIKMFNKLNDLIAIKK
ncbi:SRPBCC domain-containing protein [Pedobacter panaciterrae]|jgi:Uncharacterized conserved protein|uniref:SRPBCC family protein n=1 Tax=Pedobacter panaciterrae TaxID=363849 RepID=UPI00155DA156|nr:SRPBCC domain-containing protein [Pedobacter panaciterrae]NQX54827.1 SRPBCC domain-containing protein [Pedobacter panaciterrae]